MSEREQRRWLYERPREPTWRVLVRVLFVLTLPCYCVGFSILGGSFVWGTVQRGDPMAPWLVLGVLVIVLAVLTEPFHGGLSTCAEVGMGALSASDPIGCGVMLLLVLAVVAIMFILARQPLPFALPFL